ncbi:MAG: TOPRIM nucleotidyl transferase/hydrolase domain-containing protein, partial [Nitrospirales bacterium]
YKHAGREGLGIDTLVVLEERMDLRIQVEATLSHLFNRKIFLEWDSGMLLARATLGTTGTSYRLDREECHGIKELLVLLTNLYNDEYPYLIIDEPELNLHPQYQAFFMQEVRKVAGAPRKGSNKKIIFLITHSPFILDFKDINDVKSVISFSLDHEIPRQILDLDAERSSKIESLVPRLNVHHKQLFFSDNPIFVEGILDAQLIATIQEARGVSVAGAGSCIIDAGGCEEVNKYLELCLAFGKKAYFLYDLDSLFTGNLRACIKGEGDVRNFLATAGLGSDFVKYCGEFDRKLTDIINELLGSSPKGELEKLMTYLNALGPKSSWEGKDWAKARVAVLTAISRHKAEVEMALSVSVVDEVIGRLKKIVEVLREKNIYLLPGGTLERYLPKYQGNPYDIKDEFKRQAVADELIELSRMTSEADIQNRYGDLYEAVSLLPSKLSVDVDPVIRGYLSQYIHDLQIAIVTHPSWGEDQLLAHLNTVQKSTTKVFSIRKFERNVEKQFSAEVVVAPMLGKGQRLVRVSNTTNAGMGDFTILDI